jgi:ABC-2 type transport system ATP-binding protein
MGKVKMPLHLPDKMAGDPQMPRNGPKIIEIENICKSYGAIHALRNITLTVREGEVLGLLGPNGAGKTTMMKIVACFTPPSSGNFRVGGMDGSNEPLGVQSLIGYMPEHNPLYLEMTVRGFLTYVGRAKSLKRETLRSSIQNSIHQCGLETVKDRIIKHLSKGYRQRVGLAQAIMGDPQVLILDEPTIGLDPGQVVEMRERIKAMGGKRTVIFSSHILSEVSQICDRVAIISQGRLLAEDPPNTLIEQLARSIDLELEIKGSPEKVIEVIRKIPGVRTAHQVGRQGRYKANVEHQWDVRARIARSVVENGLDLLEMHVREMDLEQIFLRIVAHENGKDEL